MKRLFLFFLSLLAFGCLKAYDFYECGIFYNITSEEDLTVEVVSANGMAILIPSSVTNNGKTYSVTSICDRAFVSQVLTSITIPSSMKSIGSYAFYLSALKSITFTGPSSLTSIGAYAFSGCNLTSIDVPSSMTSIGDYTFANMWGLTSISIPSSVTNIGSNAFSGCSSLATIEIPSSITSIGDSTFANIGGLTSITIPSSVTSIGSYAFYNCSNLATIDIPSSVTSIGAYAFSKCSNLATIDIPSSVTSIGSYAFFKCSGLTTFTFSPSSSKFQLEYGIFAECTALTTIDIPTCVRKISLNCFLGCKALKSVDIPSNVEGIDASAFWGCTSLKSIDIHSNIEYIANYAFSGCTSLENVTLHSGALKYISKSAFNGCRTLASINIPIGVIYIGPDAFSYCSGLTSLEIPSSVTTIRERAFFGCSGLTSLEIPSSVTSIGGSAFSGCSGLTSLEILSSVTSIGDYAFSSCSALDDVICYSQIPVEITNNTFSHYGTLHVVEGCAEVYESAENWNNFTIVDDLSLTYPIEDGQIYATPKVYAEINEVVYSRSFSAADTWQSLYVPFSIPVDTLTKYGLTVIELNDTHMYDTDGDGVLDQTTLEFQYLKSDSTEANYPYLIKAAEAGEVTLTLKGATLKAAAETQIECSTTRQTFTITGTYSGVTGEDMYNNNYYAMGGGSLVRVSSTDDALKPQRWYLSVENKDGTPVSYYAPSMRIVIDGNEVEEGETGISNLSAQMEHNEVVYSLDGRCVNGNAALTPGFYVKNHQKIVVR